VLDCLLPNIDGDGKACGFGIIQVKPTGVDHKVCGSEIQPCKTLMYAIGVMVEGGRIELSSQGEFNISNVEIENQHFTVAQVNVPQYQSSSARIISKYQKERQPLVKISVNSSVVLERLKISFDKNKFEIFSGPYFQTTTETSTLTIRDCILEVVDSGGVIEETFVENSGGEVIIEGCEFMNVLQIKNKPLFDYKVGGGYSSFVVKNTILKNKLDPITVYDTTAFLRVTNTTVEVGKSYVKLYSNEISNLSSAASSSVINGLVLSIDFSSSSSSFITGIDISCNVFSEIHTSGGNGGALYLNLVNTLSQEGSVGVYDYYLYNNIFLQCVAELGGGIYISQVYVQFYLCSFYDCGTYNIYIVFLMITTKKRIL
jgi:hypothetical protein